MNREKIEALMETVRNSLSKDAWNKRRAETVEHVIGSLNEVGTDASIDAAFMVNDFMADYRSLLTRVSELEEGLRFYAEGDWNDAHPGGVNVPCKNSGDYGIAIDSGQHAASLLSKGSSNAS